MNFQDTSTRSGDCFARNFIVDWRWWLESILQQMVMVREGMDDWKSELRHQSWPLRYKSADIG